MAEIQVSLSDDQFEKFMKLQELPLKQAFSIKDCSILLSVSERGLRDLIARGEFPSFRVGNRLLVSRSSLTDWIDEQTGRG